MGLTARKTQANKDPNEYLEFSRTNFYHQDSLSALPHTTWYSATVSPLLTSRMQWRRKNRRLE